MDFGVQSTIELYGRPIVEVIVPPGGSVSIAIGLSCNFGVIFLKVGEGERHTKGV